MRFETAVLMVTTKLHFKWNSLRTTLVLKAINSKHIQRKQGENMDTWASSMVV
jgi:hypothetical protein